MAEAGIDEVADGGRADRDIVVVSDRTPAGWLARADLRDPIGVVATSIPLPLRGVLGRFQWVDYRTRRKQTLRALARYLKGDRVPLGGDEVADVPERLKQLRLPPWVVVAEWTLFAMGTLAAYTGAWALALFAFEDRRALVWPSGLCLAVAPFPFLLRRRRLTPLLLVAGVAAFWAALIALGLDAMLREEFPAYDRGSYSAATIIYPALSAVIIGLAWRSLRRWLPLRLRTGARAEPGLGYVRGSLVWVAFLVPAIVTAVGGVALDSAVLDDPEPALAAPARAAPVVCRDQAGLAALTRPLTAAEIAVREATSRTVVAAWEERIRAATGLVRELERYETESSWGAEVKPRLIAALQRSVRADRAYLGRKIDERRWQEEREELRHVSDDLAAPVGCSS